jgi:hypothetical protein
VSENGPVADTSSTIRQPAIRALLALTTILAALAAAVAVCDATVLTHLSEHNARRLATVIGRAHTTAGHTDVLGLAATMRHTVVSSIVFAVLAVAYALLTVRVTRLAMHRGRIIIWLAALVVGIAQLVWIAAESSTVFDPAPQALLPAELRQPGAAEAYARLLPVGTPSPTTCSSLRSWRSWPSPRCSCCGPASRPTTSARAVSATP